MRRMQNCQRTLISLSQLLLILRLGVTACKSGNSPPSVSQEHPLRLPGKPCLDEDQNYGLVFGGSCCFQEWICDGYGDQPGCEENLDEGEEPGQGCNLFPESGCRSSNGKNHFKCEKTGECFEKEEDAKSCEIGGKIAPQCPDGEWKCTGGGCIPYRKLCDGFPDCKELNSTSSDEEKGCNLFNDQECKSLGGRNYSRCTELSSDDPLICTDQKVDPGAGKIACRQCPEKDEWRCNDGQCIHRNKTRDGVQDCEDGSDEEVLPLTFYNVVCTILSVIFASSFFIGVCKAFKGQENSRVNEGGKDHLEEEFPEAEIPVKLIALLDDMKNSWRKIELGNNQADLESNQRDSLEDAEELILGRWSRFTVMKEDSLQRATEMYKKVHKTPLQLRHLFAYLVNRAPTDRELGRVAKYVMSWEMDLHGQNKEEVFRCWQRHLGAGRLALAMIESTKDKEKCASRLRVVSYPIRYFIRTCRRWALGVEKNQDSKLYKAYTFVRFGAIPLFEILIFNFEQIKNVIYANIIFKALQGIEEKDNEDIGPFQHVTKQSIEHEFEFALTMIMVSGVLLSQIIIRCFANVYAEDIYKFHVFKKPSCTPERIFYQIIAFAMSPLVPTYTMINHVIYSARLHRTRRHLQTAKGYENKEKVEARIDLYRRILFLENKTLKYRKIYSYFRVTSALLDSASCLVALVLLFLVGDQGHGFSLYRTVGYKLNSFYNDLPKSSESVKLVRDYMIGYQQEDSWILASIVWSLVVILTALVRYWCHAKDQALTYKGQICLCLYFLALTFNRLTTLISLLFNTQPFDGSEPAIPLEAATILLIALTVIRPLGVIVVKMKFSEKFRMIRPFTWGKLVDRLVNVIVNCLVVTRYLEPTNDIMHWKEEIKTTSSRWEFAMLFLFVIWENILSLVIEAVNGGQRTSKGPYYSWDIRLFSLLLALFFIAVYYKRYHMTAQVLCLRPHGIECPLSLKSCKTEEDPEADEDKDRIQIHDKGNMSLLSAVSEETCQLFEEPTKAQPGQRDRAWTL